MAGLLLKMGCQLETKDLPGTEELELGVPGKRPSLGMPAE